MEVIEQEFNVDMYWEEPVISTKIYLYLQGPRAGSPWHQRSLSWTSLIMGMEDCHLARYIQDIF